MNINTSVFKKSSADPRIWENERHERVAFIPFKPGHARVMASKSLLSPMINAVVEAANQGKSSVEVAETRGF